MSPLPALFHGTSSTLRRSILAKGLIRDGSYRKIVALASDFSIAWHHAKTAAEWDRAVHGMAAEPIAFEIDPAGLYTELLRPETGFIDCGPSAGPALGWAQLLGRNYLVDRDWTWAELLDHAGVVGYAGTIAPQHLIPLSHGKAGLEEIRATVRLTDYLGRPPIAA